MKSINIFSFVVLLDFVKRSKKDLKKIQKHFSDNCYEICSRYEYTDEVEVSKRRQEVLVDTGAGTCMGGSIFLSGSTLFFGICNS